MFSDRKADLMREFVKAGEQQDIDKALSLCTDEVVWETPVGTFRGKEEVRRYMVWNGENTKGAKFEDTEIGILVQGDKGSYEHKFSGIVQGEKVNMLMMCTYEFSNDHIKSMKTVFDRLAIAEQASSKWLPKKIVNTLINTLQKGLD